MIIVFDLFASCAYEMDCHLHIDRLHRPLLHHLSIPFTTTSSLPFTPTPFSPISSLPSTPLTPSSHTPSPHFLHHLLRFNNCYFPHHLDHL